MGNSSSSSSSSGIGAAGALGVAFVVLKLIGVIDWSWLWVLAPFWIGLALFLFIGGGILLFIYLSDKIDKKKRAKRAKKIEENGKASFVKTK